MTIITSVDELKTYYGVVTEASTAKVTSYLTPAYRRMIERSPFVALATVAPEGLDCSPRGDRSSVVRIEDDKTLALPDWRGNNRIDSLLNIVRDPRVALMFLIPGSSSVMRINGRAVVSVAPDLLGSFEMDGRHPRSVALVTIEEAYFQCARAVMRAELWSVSTQVAAEGLPTAGDMLKSAKADFDRDSYDREWPERAAKTMW
ncbi:PPOX class probable FMN-dependent enzyme [Peteryoungia aggregata LMG 23059]|uniref:PPOX class probable FMN-dependent enzyme n=1 Tax=Peteryoungia aggregata LMG 23059 TaxID=1368425 RepID=A0ABU0G7V6_9HYPH|nr:pyridoxamine 5'-phosphate oxidase family protein [Peteryoungia aggregata]MDQ0421424.1 PPOX class probable FMN-dependent enzyme [Peteryoungia aggregata LMG 23059]